MRVRVRRRRSPSPQPKKLHVGNLTRNVNEEHLREIFGQWGKLLRVELGWDRRIDQPKGFAYVEYDKYADSVEALKRMDGVRLPFLPPPSPTTSSTIF